MTISSKGPVFIVGSPRSGTTLLQYMLRAHPSISLPTGESHFIIPLMRAEHKYGDLSKRENIQRVFDFMLSRSEEFLLTDLHGLKFNADELIDELLAKRCSSMRDIFSLLFEKNARGEGKTRWGDKTPYYVLHMDKILRWWPDAQFIHLIRDGRDVALSLFDRKHDFYVYNAFHAARYWQQYVEIGHSLGSSLPPGHYMEIRYEEILGDQAAALKKICEFLGEPYSDDLLQYKKAGVAGKTPLLQQPVKQDNQEKWRSKMTPGQLDLFERAAGDSLLKFGYSLSRELPGKLPLPIRAAYRLHNHVLSAWHRWLKKRRRKK